VNGGGWNLYSAPLNNAQWAEIDNDNDPAGVSNGQVRYRHQLGAEFAFCDGHVKRMNRGTVTIFNWQISGDTQDVLSKTPANYYGPYR